MYDLFPFAHNKMLSITLPILSVFLFCYFQNVYKTYFFEFNIYI